MKTVLCLSLTITLGAIHPVVQADVLELKDGKVLTGNYVGGTAATVRFETSQGTQVVETSKILALTFTGANASPSQATSSSAPAPTAPAPSQAAVSVPTGTDLLVRMVDGASSNDSKGKRFTTTLESDLIIDGRMVAKAGTKIYGRVENAQRAGRFAGQSMLDLRLTDVTIGGTFVTIVTGPYAQAGAKSMRKTARGAAAGAAIGAIADGGDGAAKGAAIGAVASGVKKGQAVVVSPGTLIEFELKQPFTVSAGQ